jgi:3-oxoacyl-(acyl-carrier-protein) synthase
LINQQSYSLEENPKLLFSLHALDEVLQHLPQKIRPEIGFYAGAGLEEVSIEKLQEPLRTDTHICSEIPPTLLSDILVTHYGLRAPAVSIVAACAASTQAIGLAFQKLRRGALDLAIAGGCDSMLFPFGINAFNSLGALAEGFDTLKPFHRERRGTILGEGATFFLLANTQAIKTHNLVPRAQLIGYGSSMDACHPVMPDPTGQGAILSMKRALADAKITTDCIDYINCHGSGTSHNDRVETEAIRTLFGGAKKLPFYNSTKPFFGHLLSAGGAIELLSTLYCLEKQTIPPTLNLTDIDPACLTDGLLQKACKTSVNIAISNSFGLNGQNATLILRKVSKARKV